MKIKANFTSMFAAVCMLVFLVCPHLRDHRIRLKIRRPPKRNPCRRTGSKDLIQLWEGNRQRQ